MSPFIRFVIAKSEKFTSSGDEINTDYTKIFQILKKSPQLKCIGVEFFGNKLTEKKVYHKQKN